MPATVSTIADGIDVMDGVKFRRAEPRPAGADAGELILLSAMAIRERLKIGALAGVIVPYPTLSEISKRVAGSYDTETLFGPRTRTLVRPLGWLG